MKCPNCGHAMNHHASKLLLDGSTADGDEDSRSIEAYTCPHCGTNASEIVEGE